jgi:DNA-directed RNA polymerase specialized sigma54-like protein
MPLSGIAAVINTRYCNTPAGMFHVKHFQPEKHSRKSTPGKTIQETDPGNGSGKAIQKTGSKYRIQAEELRKLSGNETENLPGILTSILKKDLKKRSS